MDKRDLERWLCAPGAPIPAPPAIAAALGLPVHAIADTTLLRTAHHVRSLRLTLALLRDAFANDWDMWQWLGEPRSELGGRSPRAALLAGRTHQVEALAVATWNERSCVGAA
jgi:hypothetical protein